jgi:hypothetical protein
VLFFLILLAAFTAWVAFLVFVVETRPDARSDREGSERHPDDYPLLTEHRFFTR